MSGWRCSWSGISFVTPALNAPFLIIGQKFSCFFRIWFDIGVWVGTLLTISAALLLLETLSSNTLFIVNVLLSIESYNANPAPASQTPQHSITRQQYHSTSDGSSSIQIVPLLPGVTIPLNHIVYLWFGAVVSLLFHEVGHALAATSHNVRVSSSGFMITFIPPVPVAFVNVGERDEAFARVRARLRIYYAGVWQNVILCILIFGVWNVGGWMFSVICTDCDAGLLAVEVSENSAIKSRLHAGDALLAVNSIAMDTVENLRDHLVTISSQPTLQPGFCIPNQSAATTTYLENMVPSKSCCLSDAKDFTKQCFYTQPARSKVSGAEFNDLWQCYSMNDLHGLELPMCQKLESGAVLSDCAPNFHCVFPVLQKGHVMARMSVRNTLRNGEDAVPSKLLYIGSAKELMSSIRLRQGVAADWVLFILQIFPSSIMRWLVVDFPYVILPQLCYYTIAVSAGIAFLNSLPIWGFDGAHVLSVGVSHLPNLSQAQSIREFLEDEESGVHFFGHRRQIVIHRCIVNTCTGIFALNVGTALLRILLSQS